jgi:hypothetical protein
MKFKKKLFTQTELGRVLGASSHEIGRWLVEAGLRTKGKQPTCMAQHDGYCETESNGTRGYRWLWNAEKTVSALVEDGHLPASPPPGDLIESSTMNGPFTLRTNEHGTHEIIGADGLAVFWAVGEQNAITVIGLLNLAVKHGVLDRLKAQPTVQTPKHLETERFVVVA